MVSFFSGLLIVALTYLVIIAAFGSLFWVLGNLWKQLLSKSRACAECGEIFVWRRSRQQILCNKCQDFVGMRKGAMGL